MIKRAFVLVALGLFFMTPPAMAGKPYTQGDADRAILIIRGKCDPLGFRMWDDLVDIKAVEDDEHAPYRLAKGWKRHIYLTVKIPPTARLIPAHVPGVGRIHGHTLHFIIGSGKNPGFFISKRVGRYLCGESYDSGDDLFISAPEMNFLEP